MNHYHFKYKAEGLRHPLMHYRSCQALVIFPLKIKFLPHLVLHGVMMLLQNPKVHAVSISKQSSFTENTSLMVGDRLCAHAKLAWLHLSLPNISQCYKVRRFIMKESSFPSCDFLGECKQDSLADNKQFTVSCIIVSIVSVKEPLCASLINRPQFEGNW